MDMRGQQHILADRATVWEALNDPRILKACIPGCQELTKSSDTEMTAVAVIKVGPVSARFQGAVTLSDLDPPNGYRISGEGQGGVAGFAKGTAVVRLEPVDDGTLLRYEVDAQIGGKLSQLGGRLIDATARKMSGLFFEKFAQEIQKLQTGASVPVEASPPAADRPLIGGSGPDALRPAVVTPVSAGSVGSAPAPISMFQLVGAGIVGGVLVLLAAWYAGLAFRTGTPASDGIATPWSPEFLTALHLVLAAAIGYLFGTLRRR